MGNKIRSARGRGVGSGIAKGVGKIIIAIARAAAKHGGKAARTVARTKLGGKVAKVATKAIIKNAVKHGARHTPKPLKLLSASMKDLAVKKMARRAVFKEGAKKVTSWLAGKAAEAGISTGVSYGITHAVNKRMMERLQAGVHSSASHQADERTFHNRTSLLDYFPKSGNVTNTGTMSGGPQAAAHGQAGDIKTKDNVLSDAAGEGLSRILLGRNKKLRKYIHAHSEIYKGRKDSHRHHLNTHIKKEKNNYGSGKKSNKESKKSCYKKGYQKESQKCRKNRS